MTGLVYPSALPCPRVAPLQRYERRQLSNLPGPRQSRPVQRDRYSTQTLEFICRTPIEMQAWLDWYETDLGNGAHWFAAEWPQPEGGTGVRRFVGAPVFAEVFRPRGGWRIQIECRIRGRGELPEASSYVDADILLHGDESNPARWKDFSFHRRPLTNVVYPGGAISGSVDSIFGGGAMSFSQVGPGSGSSAYYNQATYIIADGGLLDPGDEEFLWSAFVKVGRIPGDSGIYTIANNQMVDGGNLNGINFGILAAPVEGIFLQFFASWTNTGGTQVCKSGIDIVPNVWTHVAASRKKVPGNPDHFAVYVAGNRGNNQNVGGAITFVPGTPLLIGASTIPGIFPFGEHVTSYGFQGLIDELYMAHGNDRGLGFDGPTIPIPTGPY